MTGAMTTGGVDGGGAAEPEGLPAFGGCSRGTAVVFHACTLPETSC